MKKTQAEAIMEPIDLDLDLDLDIDLDFDLAEDFEEIDMSKPLQELFDDCLNFISVSAFEEL